MLVMPAIDLLGDDAVRLERGDYDRVLLRDDDPVGLAARFAAAGASVLHLVDLDGARSGSVRPELIARVVAAASPMRVQASGGIRSRADAQALLDAGAERVVVGTAAFRSEALLEELVDAFGARVVVAIDSRDGAVAISGWGESTGVAPGDAAARLADAGVQRLLCTAAARDGTMSGPDLALVAEVIERSGLPVIAAGGVASADDLDDLAALGAEAAVVGRALLTGALPLSVLGYRSATTTSDRSG